MKQPHLSIDLSRVAEYSERLDSLFKGYYRVWSSGSTKGMFIRSDAITRFNHILPWSIDCQNVNSEILFAFQLMEEQIAKGVTDTKQQGEVKWFTVPDVIMQYYCNDIAYRIRSIWDKLGQIINAYFLKSKYKKEDVDLYKVKDALRKTPYNYLHPVLQGVVESKTFKELKSYRDDFTHNLTQELANMRHFSGTFWHTDELANLLLDGYKQIVETFEYVFECIGKDAASTAVTNFQEMYDRTPFFKG